MTLQRPDIMTGYFVKSESDFTIKFI